MATRDQLIDELLKEYKTSEDFFGRDGLLKQLTKDLVERILQAEMTISRQWRKQWEQLSGFFAYPEEIRKVIYTTNALGRVFAFFTLAGLAGSTLLQAQEEGYPPGTFQLASETDLHLEPVPLEVAEKFKGEVPENIILNLPPGFSAEVFAVSGLQRPRFMAFSPAGVLYVADMRGGRTKDAKQGRIVAFPDRDGDGVADEAVVVADQLSYAHSLAFYRGDLYVAETHQIVRFRDGNGDGTYEEREVFVADIPDIPSSGWHGTRTIVFDERNEKLYLGVGSPCDLCRDEEPVAGETTTPLPQNPEWGTILQFNADGTGRRVFARGIRNAIGMALHPVTNELWGTHNHYNLGGPHLPPEWIDILRDGGFYGYPFAHGYQEYVDFTVEEYEKILPLTRADSLRVQRMQRPVALLPAHLAPMAIHFYAHDLFPPVYRNAAFVALRGGLISGNLAAVPGFKVVALFSEPDGSNARVADFLTGFEISNRVWGKPVGLTTDSQGNLYVSSDATTSAIFRIKYIPIAGSWEHSLPNAIIIGTFLNVDVTVHLERFVPEGEPPVLTADLSELGGPESLPLTALGDNTYRLQTTFEVNVPFGLREIRVKLEQDTPLGFFSNRLIQTIEVVPTLPTEDLVVFADAVEGDWTLDHNTRLAVEPADFQEHLATVFQVIPNQLGGWSAQFLPATPVHPAGYKALRFAFHPGDMTTSPGSTFRVTIARNRSAFVGWPVKPADVPPAKKLDLLSGKPDGIGVNIDLKDWQVVEIPLDLFEWSGPIELIGFSGTAEGTFYLDDVRLVVEAPPATAVREEDTTAFSPTFSLEQNYPNPLNSSAVIRYALSEGGAVELAVYNLKGQKVAILVEGMGEAGVYTVSWDGRNERGRKLATGLYLYRLQVGKQIQVRKLLLIR